MALSQGLFDLSGRVAVVTGGNRGLGRAIALALADAGAAIAIIARDQGKSHETLDLLAERGARAIALKADFIERPDYQALLGEVERQLGGVSILVNNAAFAILKGVLEQSAEEWDDVIETNLTACFLLAKHAAQSMIARGSGGKIINVSSIAGNFGTPVFPSYAVSKAALQGLTRCLAIELAPHNIQANSLVPGWFATDMTQWIRTDPAYAAALQEMVQRTPRGRFGEAEELSGAVVFLASAASDHMTGAELVIDGGFSIR
ncbi:MAG TPA: SDR family oxidoreductase [Candidatus Binataceae bacterium]|nr:SDR family oxidoreductase [Candidatus Binataceae bacterium]